MTAVENARAGRNTPASRDKDMALPIPVRERIPERQADFGL